MIQAQLKVVGGRQDGKLISLPPGKFLVGREEDCNLRPKSELVSRHHCVFHIDEFSLRLRDLGSTNGTVVNGERIVGQVTLHPDDHVKIGNLEFLVRTREVAEVEPELESDPLLEGTAAVSSSETLMDMPVPPEIAGERFPEDQTVVEPPPGHPGAVPPNMPQPVLFQPPMPMPGYPGYPQYGQYPGYPQMPYPGQPMYAYPQMPGGYPPMQGGYPQQQAPPPEAAPAGPAKNEHGGVAAPPPKLPDPSTTGVRAPAPKPAQPAAAPAGNGEENPSQRAEDIIRSYMKKESDEG
jgi:pSer/pThr/pTyr-binding forkhead associated (FHA) protein